MLLESERLYPNSPTTEIDDRYRGNVSVVNESLYLNFPTTEIDDRYHGNVSVNESLYPDFPMAEIDNEKIAADHHRARSGNHGEIHSGSGNVNLVIERLEVSSGLRADSLGLSILNTRNIEDDGVEGCRSNYANACGHPFDYGALVGMK